MFIKKHATFILITVLFAFSYACGDRTQTQMWRERSEKAFTQKNSAYGLLYALRAEQTAGLFDRFNLVSMRVGLQKQEDAPFLFAGRVIAEFLSSLALFFPLAITQLVCLVLFLYIAQLISLLGIAVAARQNWGLWLLCLSLTVFLAHQYQLDGSCRAVFLPQSAVLLSGPGESFASVGSLKGPQAVFVRKQSGVFCKIQSGFMNGWILSKSIKIV